MTRILVTGASGFIGRFVSASLAEQGYTIRAAVRRLPHPPLAAGIEVVEQPDLAEAFDWRPLLAGVDKVIHLAGIAHAGGTAAALYDAVNRLGTARLAAAAARAAIDHFVFISSIRAQSGPWADHALSERDAPTPTDAYGRSKLAAEAAVAAAGVPFTILRPVAVYGVGVKGNFALLLRAALSGWPLPVQDFTNRRSLLSIDNFVSAVTLVLSSQAARGEIFIVADPGMPPRLADVFAILRRAQGRRPLILPMPRHYVKNSLRLIGRGELWHSLGGNLRVDVAKLLACGWQPAHDTRSGLAALAAAASRRTPGGGRTRLAL